MNYKLLLCVSKELLMAFDVSEEKIETISLEGNDSMKIESESSIEDFCHHIKDYYNICSFSDIKFEIKIIDFSPSSLNGKKIYQSVKEAKSVNLIDFHTILPIFLLMDRSVKVDDRFEVLCFQSSYFVKIDKQLKVIYTESEESVRVNIPTEKLGELFFFHCNGLGSNELEILEIEKKYKTLLDEKNTEIKQLREKHEKSIQELSQKQKEYENYRKSVENDKEQKNREFISKRRVISFDLDEVKRKHLHGFVSGFLFIACKFILNSIFRDGEIINSSTNIATVRDENNGSYGPYNIISPTSGRIYYLKKHGTEVKGKVDIAIVADPSDTKEEVMKWYNGLSR